MKIIPLSNLSPVNAFKALEDLERPFILHGGKIRGQSRYSYVSAEPSHTLTTDYDGTTLTELLNKKQTHLSKNPFTAISEALKIISSNSEPPDMQPFPFCSGGVGYLSFDLKNLMPEEYPKKTLGNNTATNPKFPLASFSFYKTIYVFDHLKDEGFLVSSEATKKNTTFKKIEKALQDFKPLECSTETDILLNIISIQSTLPEQEYISTVTKALEYIRSGDIYQINISTKFTIKVDLSPFSLFKKIIKDAPSRFQTFIDCGTFQIISNSPERLLSVTGNRVLTEPIKGTRARGRTTLEDDALRTELSESKKEQAEHLMVVDLERNDLGRVCVAGSIKVEGFKRIETYPRLHHMVSSISGHLRKNLNLKDALQATFPGGSITGTPKVRSIEIIEELENAERGIYTGGLGFIDLSGNGDFSMAIRTAVYSKGELTLSVGSGIVADSDPRKEYEETLLKAEDFFKALGLNYNKYITTATKKKEKRKKKASK
ncbi:MAG: aminodeoxychorismate synthase component I [Deltaproteobacteria bacterium]|nr:aminodeoxychorismate synthase component I [Deltaproteobacteria bacterium]